MADERSRSPRRDFVWVKVKDGNPVRILLSQLADPKDVFNLLEAVKTKESPKLDTVAIGDLQLFQSEGAKANGERCLRPDLLIGEVNGGNKADNPLYIFFHGDSGINSFVDPYDTSRRKFRYDDSQLRDEDEIFEALQPAGKLVQEQAVDLDYEAIYEWSWSCIDGGFDLMANLQHATRNPTGAERSDTDHPTSSVITELNDRKLLSVDKCLQKMIQKLMIMPTHMMWTLVMKVYWHPKMKIQGQVLKLEMFTKEELKSQLDI
ncbi:unnamed protein product [Effrenium voratum]|nr:unnamed protein product [Effrenium voratum]CAJ1439952.1 unnamed protein product [Effrenium voratum]CAJ1455905.1 unnamed protein product [Effrenium voratum]